MTSRVSRGDVLRALALTLLALASPTVTQLAVTADAPDPAPAGADRILPVDVHLEGPTRSPLTAAGAVEITVQDADAAGCQAPDDPVLLSPTDGSAHVDLPCTPTRPGEHDVTVLARSPPHGPGRWNGTLLAEPDVLTGALELGEPSNLTIPLRLDLAPEHLEHAPVNVTLQGRLDEPAIGFEEGPYPVNATGTSLFETELPARHGPGDYHVTARASGPWTQPTLFEANITVPQPEALGHLKLNVTVEPGEPSVELTSSSVNEDGKRKYPGDSLITRLQARHTDTVNVTVTRPAGDGRVVLDRQTLPVDADGELEHVFEAPVLPAGLIRVEASAGESRTARTAQIQDVRPEATVDAPAEVLGDGRTANLTVHVHDANHGSTDLDPGPVWGLPDLRWRVFHGSTEVDGWTTRLGPFEGTGHGQAPASRIPWPTGLAWAPVDPGVARLPLELTPPPNVEPGTYRVSLYEDDDRLGGTSFEIVPPPTVHLDAPEVVPGQSLPVDVNITHTQPDTNVTIQLLAPGHPPVTQTTTGNRTLELPVPVPLRAGTELEIVANATWPGRPPSPSPDVVLERTVPALAPSLDPSIDVDGVPAPVPAALHPSHMHEIVVHPRAWDPNGDPIDASARLIRPDGSVIDEADGDTELQLRLPAEAAPGRYRIEAEASSPDGETNATLPVDVGQITRVGVEGPTELVLTEDTPETAPLTVRNRGTVPLEAVVVDVQTPEGIDASLRSTGDRFPVGDPVPLALDPGQTRTLDLELVGHEPSEAPAQVQVLVAGVAP